MKNMLTISCLALCVTACSSRPSYVRAAASDGSGSSLIVSTQYGKIEGQARRGIREFLGIPYARPPLGQLRWRPPVPPIKWHNIELATSYGGSCAQGENGTFSDPTGNEDCLYLNVFTPVNPPNGSKLPVMVWIYGGGLNHGSSNPYNPSKLVSEGGVIVVTLNYRMNIFGFLSLPGLDKEDHKSGNYGLMDQQFALQWVKNNILLFGGDPGNVTIFGESAGGLSVLANMISPTAKGLFSHAIVQSGTYTGLDTPVKLSVAEKRGEGFAVATGCKKDTPRETVNCLRALSSEAIQSRGAKYADTGTALVIDGTVLDKTQEEAFTSGDFNRVPIILGTNKDEATNFIGHSEYLAGSIVTPRELINTVNRQYGKRTPKVLEEYTLSEYKRPDLALSAIITDSVFVCPGLLKAALLSRYVPTYYYEFADQTAPVYLQMAPIPYGAYHSSEIQYLFVGFHGARGRSHVMDDEQKGLSTYMVRYWTNFAASRDSPNTSVVPLWPHFTENAYLSLEDAVPRASDLSALRKAHHCGLWDSLRSEVK